MEKYNTYQDNTNVWWHVSGGGCEESEQLPNYTAARRSILHDAFFSDKKKIMIDGQIVDVVGEVRGDKYFARYHSREISSAAAALGSIKSDKKTASSRENGKKGGRPKSRYIEIDTKGRFCLLATAPKKEDGVVNYRKYGLLAKFDGFSPAMRPVWADARMCFLYDDETPTASQISAAWDLMADELKYSHEQEYNELIALFK